MNDNSTNKSNETNNNTAPGNMKGNWDVLKGKIMQKWGRFSDNDMTYIKGNIEELKGRLENVYGYTKERAVREFEEFKKNLYS